LLQQSDSRNEQGKRSNSVPAQRNKMTKHMSSQQIEVADEQEEMIQESQAETL